ncbi:hypothetical protein SNL152K_7648 [Streptomyces sp. NL15-2K]|nr:hypothetical protein SNL152K_7648 [Streptomyces sp. NL15-2K]
MTFVERRHRTPSRTGRQQGGRAGVALRLTAERRMGASRSTPPAFFR